MPLYEFECIPCRKAVTDSIVAIEKKPTKKTIEATVKKFESINSIILVDLNNEKEIARAGKIGNEDIDIDLYVDDGKIMVLYFVPNFRFSELVMDEEDEKNIKCPCCNKKNKVERVISSFSYTSDLSTDPPKPPGMKDLPKEIRGKLAITDYVEEKDRPANIKRETRYKHQYQDKSKRKLL